MDGQRFDKLTRTFATGIDRRTLLKIFGGATVAGVAGMAVARPTGVFAQGSSQPGEACQSDADCAQGSCDPNDLVCYCEDPGRPWVGCACNTGVQDACDGRAELCCPPTADAAPGAAGTCVSPMIGECVYPVDNSCISGTADACVDYNEANGTDYICCTYGGDPGSEGSCVAEDACVVSPPNTGAGVTAETESLVAPTVAVGAAAAVIAYKTRGKKSGA